MIMYNNYTCFLFQFAIEKKATLYIDGPAEIPGPLKQNNDYVKFGYGYYVGAPSGWQDKPRVGQQYLSYIASSRNDIRHGCVWLCVVVWSTLQILQI